MAEIATFGILLRHYRLAAGFSQEALAERANLSAAAIGALERGRRTTPHPDTAVSLAQALELTSDHRTALLTAAAGVPERAVPLTPVPPATLPVPPTALIGRRRVDEAIQQLRHAEATGGRLLTLTGPGGVGKTRLALAVAAALQSTYAQGVVFIDLSALHDPALIASAMAPALGLRQIGGQSVGDLLIDHLRLQQMLLVLDNFEHLMASTPLVTELLSACPRLTLLVTSRTALRVRSEQQFRVLPLATPGTAQEWSIEEAAGFEAIQLFLERAQARDPAFALRADNLSAVVQICRRLDGLPLAIELAAAWVILLPPAALLARLEHRLSLLTGGVHDLPVRQRTMRATIDWSYSLLDKAEQTLFARLAVFEGGSTLEAAEAVCSADGGSGFPLTGDDVLDGAQSLLDKSLLLQTESAGEPRITMLGTLHEYARERLAAQGELAALQRVAAQYYLALAEAAEPELKQPDQVRWRARLEREHENLRAALRWACENEESDLGLRLGAGLWRFWYMGGHLSEGRAWLERLLGQSQGEATSARAWVLRGASVLAVGQGDFARGAALAAQSLAIQQALGDSAGMASALNTLGNAAREQGDLTGAEAHYEAALALRRERDDTRGMAVVFNNLGITARYQGDLARAATLHAQSLALRRDLNDTWGIATALYNLGHVTYEHGDLDQAAALAAESLALHRVLVDRPGMVLSLALLGAVASARGDAGQATALYAEGLALSRAIGENRLMANCLEGLANVARAQGQTSHAARLLAEARTLRAAQGTIVAPLNPSGSEHLMLGVQQADGTDQLLPWAIESTVYEARRAHASQMAIIQDE